MRSDFVATTAALAAMLIGPAHAFAAAGDLDTSFASAGRIVIGTRSEGDDLALQSDGKTVANAYVTFKVARFGTNGFLDATRIGAQSCPVFVQCPDPDSEQNCARSSYAPSGGGRKS